MNKSFFGLILFLFAISATAQTGDDIRVIKDDQIDFLIEKQIKTNKYTDTEDGYRIQILLSNTRDEVKDAKVKFYQDYPELRSYIVYDQPYYKLRVGNFKTRLEATKYLVEVINIYQSAYIVKDKINTRN